MTKIEELKQAFEASAQGEWIAWTNWPVGTGYAVGAARDSQAYAVCENVRGGHTTEFIALAHNLMPILLEAWGMTERMADGDPERNCLVSEADDLVTKMEKLK